jgi:hypothetical protein
MKSVLVRHSGALAVAMLALSFSFGSSTVVRAEEPETLPSALREMVFVPIMRAVQGLEHRLTSIEATVAAFADSITSRRIATRQLCLSDESGAQTCITKAQLDAFLQSQVHAAAAEPSVVVSDASTAPQAEEGEIGDTAALEADAGEIATTTATIEIAAAATPDENAQNDQEPTLTGSIPSLSQGAALVWYPEVEISTPTATPSEE